MSGAYLIGLGGTISMHQTAQGARLLGPRKPRTADEVEALRA